jgi:hypothetical protein
LEQLAQKVALVNDPQAERVSALLMGAAQGWQAAYPGLG